MQGLEQVRAQQVNKSSAVVEHGRFVSNIEPEALTQNDLPGSVFALRSHGTACGVILSAEVVELVVKQEPPLPRVHVPDFAKRILLRGHCGVPFLETFDMLQQQVSELATAKGPIDIIDYEYMNW